jgi:SAM-dependent methyltransferase
MTEINLLSRYPKTIRKINNRVATKSENRDIALEFGREYFDGSREQGYGGYHYDGRWIPIAEDIINHFGLKSGSNILDVGCAKGFLVKDLMSVCPGLEAFGIDISEYAVKNCEHEVIGRIHLGNAKSLPFPDKSFDIILSINTIHNLEKRDCIAALMEIERVSKFGAYIQVDAYRTSEEKKLFEDWMLTAKTYGTPAKWKEIMKEAGYSGDYYWTILESESDS